MARLSPEEVGLHNVRPKPGSKRSTKRVGRGEGSGMGKTSGRGHKGAGSRSGSKTRVAHEGGQNPIHMRMRKLRGPRMKKSMPFERFRTHTQPVNVADLEARFGAGDEVSPESLRAAGLAKRRDPVKILGKGDISTKLTVKAHAFSAAAKEKIEAAGGTCHTIAGTSGKAAVTQAQGVPPGGAKAADTGSEAEDVGGVVSEQSAD